jgi:hypothetical protein
MPSADEIEHHFQEICHLLGAWPNQEAAAQLVDQAERLIDVHNKWMASRLNAGLTHHDTRPAARMHRVDHEHMVVRAQTLLSGFGWFIEQMVELARIKELPGFETFYDAAREQQVRTKVLALAAKVKEANDARERAEQLSRRQHLKVIE